MGNGMNMEGCLGNLFNHGAVLVNVFGWGVGDRDNPFRKIAERDDALAAYRKFRLPAGSGDPRRNVNASLKSGTDSRPVPEVAPRPPYW